MKYIRFDLKLYGALIKLSLRGMMQYRADFWTSLLGVWILNGANLLQLRVVAWKFDRIGSWSAGDLMVLYGLYSISRSLYAIFCNHITTLESEIASGAFDRYLVRPASPFLQFIGGRLHYVGVCDTMLGVVLLVVGKGMNGIVWGWTELLWLAVFVVCGGGIMVCIQLILCCASFRVIKSGTLSAMLMQLLLLTQKYPLSIFGDTFRTIVTGIVPIAFVNYYPAVMLLNKADVPVRMCMLSPAVFLLLLALAAWVWTRSLRRYSSAGG